VTARERLRILAVDDERTQLEDLARLLRTFEIVEDVECAFDGRDALAKVSSQQYDAIFLDVRMPDLDGIELGRVLRRFASPPQLVFVSAHDTAAVEAFELHALDYLRKPVSRGRAADAIERVAAALDTAPALEDDGHGRQPPGDGEMIAAANVRTGSTRLIARGSILYAQSHGDFVRIVTPEGRFLIRHTLSEIERRWQPHGFVRVHRQFLANLPRAVEVRPLLGGTAELVFADGQAIPIARRHVGELGRRLSL
jgi:DNA-binding LytR/AlgR family response regulator